MKKLIVLVFAITLVFALSACGQKETAQPPATNNGGTTGGTTTGGTTGGTGGAAAGGAQNIKLTATNWQFDQPEYRVKQGQDVTVTLENKEGLHGAQIKDFNVNLNGQTLSKTFKADKAGTYDIICSVPCGQGHLNMKSKLIVE